jgi:hypothetical protein
MSQARTVTATFNVPTVTLTVGKGGTGSGTVTSSPAGINCGSDCSQAYALNTGVTLTVAAGTGSTFAGWSGACTGTGTCSVTMSQARTVTATFNSIPGQTAILTVTKAGTGAGSVTSSPAGINCGTDCAQTYSLNAGVTLTATPAAGSTFAGWSGACTGTGACAVSMTQGRSVTATFNVATSAGGLVAAYSFDAGSGTILADVSGNGRTGTISGATWTTGRYGSALSFDGANDWVTVADATSLDLTTGMTLMAWVNPTALSGWRSMILKETSEGLAYSLYASDGSRPASYIGTTGGEVSTAGTTTLPLNTWSHLAATYEGTTLRLYVNGTLAGTRTTTQAILSSTSPLRLGGNAVWGEYFQGKIDEVRIYNRALSQTDVQTGMNTPVEPPLTATLTVTKTGTGTGTVTSNPAGINCGSDCAQGYPANTTVTLTAAAASGSAFAGWGGACTGTAACSVSMSQARTVTATFGPNTAPAVPTGRGQREADGVTPIGLGGSAASPTVVFLGTVSDPDPGQLVRLRVEVQPVGTAFDNTLSCLSPLVSSGTATSCSVSGLKAGTGYHWRLRAVDAQGGASAWASFATNAEDAADFVVGTGTLPGVPTGRGQRQADGITPIVLGGWARSSTVVFAGTVSDTDAGQKARLQVEVKPVGTAFTGTVSCQSALVPSGTATSCSVSGLTAGTGYHWRLRAVDNQGGASAWASYATNAEDAEDFIVDAAPAVPTSRFQRQADGITPIGLGGWATSRTVAFLGTVSDPDAGQSVRLQVEVKPVGTAFTGTVSCQSALVPSGTATSCSVSGLTVGSTGYHWRLRAVDSQGGASAWASYATNTEDAADFRVTLE